MRSSTKEFFIAIFSLFGGVALLVGATAVGLALMSSGCSAPRPAVLGVLVSASGQTPPIVKLRATVKNGGLTASPVDIVLDASGVSIPPARNFNLDLGGRTGLVEVVLEAVGADGAIVGGASGSALLEAGVDGTVELVLPGRGVDGGVDGAQGDMRRLDGGVDGGKADMGPTVDLGRAPDLSPTADLSPMPDLSPAPDLAPPCGNTLAGVGAGDFSISFRIVTTAQVLSSILWQRAACDTTDMWDVGMSAAGTVGVETGNNNGNYSVVRSLIPINDGQMHGINVLRRGGVLSIIVDGNPSGSGLSQASYGTLPALGAAHGDPCEDPNNLHPLAGTLDRVCLSF